MPQFMITTRKRGDDRAMGPARYLTFEDEAGPELDLGTNPRRWLAQLMAGFAPPETDNRVNPVRSGDVLFLVHGFNVSHASARSFHMKCVAGLAAAGWHGQVISYDWPSDGLVFAYLDDRKKARDAADELVSAGIAVLQQAQQADCTIGVHVLAHSMGGFVVQQAFTWSYQDVPPDWRIGQILFASADVDHSVFSADTVTAKAFGRHGGRVTAYCNRYDKALAASNAKRLELAPRMGRVGLPDDAPALMCEIDCSGYFAAHYASIPDLLSPVVTHCFYFDQPVFWQDVTLTLAAGIDRSVFPTRTDGPAANRYALKATDKATYAQALARAATSRSIQPPPA